MGKTPAERTLAAEVRAVEAGHQARLAPDGKSLLVASDTWPNVTYRVRIHAIGEIVTFTCDHNCYTDGVRVPGRSPAWSYVPCMHSARGAQRLEREGILRWDGGRWLPTDKALQSGHATAAEGDPFDGLV